ncbi:MAG: insulinase family protein [Leptolyngbyaceae cyanobacterium RM2_2_21]|nr:insulinase family protein [Leptolyngbyaceae cyanobacterium RM2_2_21]NJN01848.1 insulinase family protein [Leptolyngbyaceae cyanobacterium RM1_1_2]
MRVTVSTSVSPPLTHRTVLSNGLTILVAENPVADIVSARIFVRAGTGYELRSQAGLFNLLAALLTKGAAGLSSMEIAERVESVGASLGTDASADYSLLSLKTVSGDFAEMLSLAGQILRFPTLPQAEFELEQRLALQGIQSMQEQPFTVAYNQLRQILYGDHPYALPAIGTQASLAALDRAVLLRAHQTYFRPDNMVVSIAGRITVEQAADLAGSVFGNWPTPTAPIPPLLFPVQPTQPVRSVLVQETHQSIVMVGYQAAAVKHPAYAALKLLNTYLGNGLSSRLFVELREKRGLAYDVSAFYPTRIGGSQFVAYIGTAPANTAIALEGLQFEVERLRSVSLLPEKLQTAKNKLLGQYALGKQTNAQIAQLLGWYETIGLGLEFDQQFCQAIAAVTVEQAQAVAEEFFVLPYVTVLGPAEAVEPLKQPE